MNAITHVGYAGRTAEKFRYDEDPREVTLEISATLARDLLDAINGHVDCQHEDSPIQQLEETLVAMGFGGATSSGYWKPSVGDEVWLNRPDGRSMGVVVGYVDDDSPRRGQPIIEAQESDTGKFALVKKGDQRACHPMFLLPFPHGGPEWKKAQLMGRIR